MADNKKYRLGDMEFDTEEEYKAAATDLKVIKGIMDQFNINDPEQAKKILASIQSHPGSLSSSYGKKFIARLEKVAGVKIQQAGIPGEDEKIGKKAKSVKQKKEKKPREKKKKEPAKKISPGNIRIFTVRNFAIGIIIIVGIVAFSVFGPKLFSMNGEKADSSDVRRNMVTAYAKAQTDLKEQLYSYYYNVVGETEEEAMNDAQAAMENYVVDLSEKTISRMTDKEIGDVYEQLVDGGDIQNNSFVEPAEISKLKDRLAAAGLAGNSGNGTEDTSVIAVVNTMMDYQERLYSALCYDYGLLGYGDEDCKAYATEDLTAIFGDVIYDFSMTESDKQSYYESFVHKGFIQENRLVRISTDPTEYNLPDLTPGIEIKLSGSDAAGYHCSMLSYAPAASVFYELHAGKTKGYLCFRNNGSNTNYVQIDSDTTVTTQGDFFLYIGGELRIGEWFYNNQNIGLYINGDTESLISYVNDLTY